MRKPQAPIDLDESCAAPVGMDIRLKILIAETCPSVSGQLFAFSVAAVRPWRPFPDLAVYLESGRGAAATRNCFGWRRDASDRSDPNASPANAASDFQTLADRPASRAALSAKNSVRISVTARILAELRAAS